jgi:hypothetical protein
VDSEAQTRVEVPACPDCGGVMRIIERFRHSFSRSSPRTSPFRCNTSRVKSCRAPRSSFLIRLRAVSIIAGDVESALSHCATTTGRCSKTSIAISGEARLISTLPRCAHLVSLPRAPSQQIGPCDLKQSPER